MRDSEIWGYARVSSSAQNLERQFEQFRAYGIDERHIVAEKQSGKDFDRRGFNSLVGTDESVPSLRAGDTLVICSIDRLGRNYGEIQRWWQYITIQFCLAISHQAIMQKSSSAKVTVSDNEKYTFRCWLLRMGLIGDEFATARKFLLENLEGYIAWRHGESA